MRSAAKELADEVMATLDALPVPDTPSARRVRRAFSRRLRADSPATVLATADRLVRNRDGIARFVAYELVAAHAGARGLLDAGRLRALGRGIDSWGAVDCFACYLSGPAWREGLIPTSLVRRWARDRDRWWRRAAVVSTVPLNNRARGGGGDAPRTLAICRLVLSDRDDMVVKALSWALRELAKREPRAVQRFLAQHGASLAPRVLREVGNKLRTGLKNPRSASR